MGSNNIESDLTFHLNAVGFESSLLLGDHSYDNYLDEILNDQDVSFAVQPSASSTPASRKLISTPLKIPSAHARKRTGLQALTVLNVNATPKPSRIASSEKKDTTSRNDSAKVSEHVEKENVSLPQLPPVSTAIPQPRIHDKASGIPVYPAKPLNRPVTASHSRIPSASGIPIASSAFKSSSSAARLANAFSAFDSLTPEPSRTKPKQPLEVSKLPISALSRIPTQPHRLGLSVTKPSEAPEEPAEGVDGPVDDILNDYRSAFVPPPVPARSGDAQGTHVHSEPTPQSPSLFMEHRNVEEGEYDGLYLPNEQVDAITEVSVDLNPPPDIYEPRGEESSVSEAPEGSLEPPLLDEAKDNTPASPTETVQGQTTPPYAPLPPSVPYGKVSRRKSHVHQEELPNSRPETLDTHASDVPGILTPLVSANPPLPPTFVHRNEDGPGFGFTSPPSPVELPAVSPVEIHAQVHTSSDDRHFSLTPPPAPFQSETIDHTPTQSEFISAIANKASPTQDSGHDPKTEVHALPFHQERKIKKQPPSKSLRTSKSVPKWVIPIAKPSKAAAGVVQKKPVTRHPISREQRADVESKGKGKDKEADLVPTTSQLSLVNPTEDVTAKLQPLGTYAPVRLEEDDEAPLDLVGVRHTQRNASLKAVKLSALSHTEKTSTADEVQVYGSGPHQLGRQSYRRTIPDEEKDTLENPEGTLSTSQDPQELEGSEEDVGAMESNIARQEEDFGSDAAMFRAQISENVGGGSRSGLQRPIEDQRPDRIGAEKEVLVSRVDQNSAIGLAQDKLPKPALKSSKQKQIIPSSNLTRATLASSNKQVSYSDLRTELNAKQIRRKDSVRPDRVKAPKHAVIRGSEGVSDRHEMKHGKGVPGGKAVHQDMTNTSHGQGERLRPRTIRAVPEHQRESHFLPEAQDLEPLVHANTQLRLGVGHERHAHNAQTDESEGESVANDVQPSVRQENVVVESSSNAKMARREGRKPSIPETDQGPSALEYRDMGFHCADSEDTLNCRSSSPDEPGGSGIKRPSLESPIRDRTLLTKKTRVDGATSCDSVPHVDRRPSGTSLVSPIVVQDDTEIDEETAVRSNDPIYALNIPKRGTKRASLEVDASLHKRPRLQQENPRRVVSHNAAFAGPSSKRPPKGPEHRPLAVPFSVPIPGEASRQRALDRLRRNEEHKKRLENVGDNRQPQERNVGSQIKAIPGSIFGAKKTVVQPFTFDLEARAAHHRAQFEERLAQWEQRTREAAEEAKQRFVVPNYAARQAEHFGKLQIARERAKANVTQPKTPGLRTKTRVVERQTFDEMIRAKEMVTIALREASRAEQEEQDRREIKHLRRRLDQNVKANPIPYWCRIDDEIEVLEKGS